MLLKGWLELVCLELSPVVIASGLVLKGEFTIQLLLSLLDQAALPATEGS